MTLSLNSRHDITLPAYQSVAWDGARVELSPKARTALEDLRRHYERLIARPADQGIYGISVGQGEMAISAMTAEDVERLARIKPLAAAVPFGPSYPRRILRGMVLSRLANLIGGHGGATPRLVDEIIAMLNDGRIPAVPQSGHGGPGEILATYALFAELSQSRDLVAGERGALINGAPCAAALLADAALVSERRITLAEHVLALAIDAFNAPDEHFRRELAELWGGDHNRVAFDRLAALLAHDQPIPQRAHQAPVSFRSVPAMLGQAHWALAEARKMAGLALSAATHNPVWLPPSLQHPDGEAFSNGGYNNALAAPVMDNLAGACVELCLLCERLSTGLLNGRVSGLPDFLLVGRDAGNTDGHGAVGYIPMAIVGYLEEARTAAQRTFTPPSDMSVYGQDNVAATAFLAWPKQDAAGRCLDACLALLAATASQALHVQGRAARSTLLAELLATVRAHVPPVVDDRVLGPEIGRLCDTFRAGLYPAE
ncbi:MAG TPA: aromatic amino acid lyase [Albidovulum sp.]|uniref:aromatic amino acid lyase n=1 Tax=Albidovulum sp. TaxID=1872424 RepID=UPI002BCE3083|nr:aromatic amino acid lyase [Albidovulum sp.]